MRVIFDRGGGHGEQRLQGQEQPERDRETDVESCPEFAEQGDLTDEGRRPDDREAHVGGHQHHQPGDDRRGQERPTGGPHRPPLLAFVHADPLVPGVAGDMPGKHQPGEDDRGDEQVRVHR